MRKRLIRAMLLCCYVAILLPFQIFAQERPNLTIISPREDETIFGNQVVFSFFTSGFLIGVDGYLHLALDKNQPIIVKEQKDFHLSDLSEGKHTLVVELINKKRQSLSPAVKKEITFTTTFPKEEKRGINLEISPAETEKTEILTPQFWGLLVFGGLFLCLLAFKFYINAKAGQNRSHQEPLS